MRSTFLQILKLKFFGEVYGWVHYIWATQAHYSSKTTVEPTVKGNSLPDMLAFGV